MNFFEILKKSSNNLIENIRGTAIYDHAEIKLKPKAYAVEAKPLYLVSKYFSGLYHLISYLVAFLGIGLFAGKLGAGGESKLITFSVFIISSILLFVIETAKANSSNSVFSAAARKDSYNKLYLGILIVTTIFSFVASVWSAQQLAYESSTFSEKGKEHNIFLSKLDSVNSIYASQEKAAESSINSASQILSKKSIPDWQKNTSQIDLKTANENLNFLRNKKESIKEKIEIEYKESIEMIGEKGADISKIAMFIFAIFEILNLVCYWFYFYYLSNCLLEKQTVLENVTTQVNEAKERNGTQQNNATDNAAVYTQPFQIPKPYVNPQKIGFQFSQNVEKNAPKTEATERNNAPKTETKTHQNKTTKLGFSNCDYCNTEFEVVKKGHRFCQKTCREKDWKQKKNRTFIKGKKK